VSGAGGGIIEEDEEEEEEEEGTGAGSRLSGTLHALARRTMGKAARARIRAVDQIRPRAATERGLCYRPPSCPASLA